MAEDNNRFEKALIRYIWRRDELEGTPHIQQSQAEHFPLRLVEALDDPLVPHPIIPMHVLPVTQARRLDVFRGKISDPREQFPDGRCDVETYDGQRLAVVRGPRSKDDLRLSAAATTNPPLNEQPQVVTTGVSKGSFGDDDGGDTAEATGVRPPPPPEVAPAATATVTAAFISQPPLSLATNVTTNAAATPHSPPAATTLRSVERAGVCCRRHPNTRLTAQMQTDIWPFSNPPTCCMVVDGKLCGEQCGVVYSCGDTMLEEVEDDCTSDDEEADGHTHNHHTNNNTSSEGGQRQRRTRKRTRTVLCTYALCDQHCRLTLFELLLSRVYAFKRAVWDNGLSWLLCIGIVFAANAAYTPFIKTALMILGCHPFYQCEFKNCWDNIDQKYALAVYLSMVVVLFFGIGFPVSLVLLLWSRKRAMDTLFLDPDYNGKYAEGPTVGKEVASPQEAEEEETSSQPSCIKKKTNQFKCDGEGSAEEREMAEAWPVSGSVGKKNTSSATAFSSQTSSSSQPPSPPPKLKHGEWARFVSTDTTALAQQYQPVFYRWMFFPGLLIVFKVLTLIPAIFAEPRSFQQRLGVALVEIGVAAFMFATTTQLSPVLLVTIRVASIHQLLVLAVQNLNLVTQNDTNVTIAPIMIGITMLYFVFTAVVIVAAVVAPTLAERYRQRRLRALLNAHGLDYARSIATYFDPTRHISAADDAEAHRLDPLVGIRRAELKKKGTMSSRPGSSQGVDRPFTATGDAHDDQNEEPPRSSLFLRRRRSSVQRPSSALFAGFAAGGAGRRRGSTTHPQQQQLQPFSLNPNDVQMEQALSFPSAEDVSLHPPQSGAAALPHHRHAATTDGSDPVHHLGRRRSTLCVTVEDPFFGAGPPGAGGFHSVSSPSVGEAATTATAGGLVLLRRRSSLGFHSSSSSSPNAAAAARMHPGAMSPPLGHTAVLQLSQQEATSTAVQTPRAEESPTSTPAATDLDAVDTQRIHAVNRMANIEAMFGGVGASVGGGGGVGEASLTAPLPHPPQPPGSLYSVPIHAEGADGSRHAAAVALGGQRPPHEEEEETLLSAAAEGEDRREAHASHLTRLSLLLQQHMSGEQPPTEFEGSTSGDDDGDSGSDRSSREDASVGSGDRGPRSGRHRQHDEADDF